MKINNISAKYIVEIGKGKRILIEDTTNEKGERFLVFSVVKSYVLPNGEKWEPKLDDAKTVKREELPEDIKRALREILSSS
ncbi:MAG: hypothetical protein QXV69_01625 [Sulfolobaceae archaeon]